jgi:hypothetical protein
MKDDRKMKYNLPTNYLRYIVYGSTITNVTMQGTLCMYLTNLTQSELSSFLQRAAAATICMPVPYLALQTSDTVTTAAVAFRPVTARKHCKLTYQINCIVLFDYRLSLPTLTAYFL